MDIDLRDKKVRWRIFGMILIVLGDVFLESQAREIGLGILELLLLLFGSIGLVVILAKTEVFVWRKTRLFEVVLYVVMYILFANILVMIFPYHFSSIFWYFMMVPISSIVLIYWDYYERGKLFFFLLTFLLIGFKFVLLVINFAIYNL